MWNRIVKVFKQKSKEDEIVFETFTIYPFFFFRTMLFTLVPLKGGENYVQKFEHFIRVNYYRTTLFVLPPCAVMMWIYAIVNFDEIMEALSAIPNGMYVTLATSKAIVTFIKRKKIWKLYQDLKEIFDSRPSGSFKLETKEHLRIYQRNIKIYAVTFILPFLPIAYPVIPYVLYGTMKPTLDFWFPFDPYTRKTFPFSLILGDFVGWSCLANLLSSDSLLFALVTLLNLEFDILKSDFKTAMSLPDSQRKEKINSLIAHHNKLLHLCDDLNEIYSPTFLSVFVITSLNVSLVAFQLSTGDADFVAYMFFGPYLTMLSGHAYLVTAYGQNIINATGAVADGIYESDWQNIDDISEKKQLVLIIQRSQKVKKFSAMGFAEVSLLSFTTIFTSAYSYFTLLKNVYA